MSDLDKRAEQPVGEVFETFYRDDRWFARMGCEQQAYSLRDMFGDKVLQVYGTATRAINAARKVATGVDRRSAAVYLGQRADAEGWIHALFAEPLGDKATKRGRFGNRYY